MFYWHFPQGTGNVRCGSSQTGEVARGHDSAPALSKNSRFGESQKEEEKTIDDLKKDCKDLQKNLAAKEKESARMKKSIRTGCVGEGSESRCSSKGDEGLALEGKKGKGYNHSRSF